MIRKTIVWIGIKLYGLIRKLYGLERDCMVSNDESYGLGRVWGMQVCPESGTGTCTLRMHIHVESVKQSFSIHAIMIFVPVVEHAPTLTVSVSPTLKNPSVRRTYEIFGLTSHCESCHGSSIKYIHVLGIVNFVVLLVITHHLFQNVRNIQLIWSNL